MQTAFTPTLSPDTIMQGWKTCAETLSQATTRSVEAVSEAQRDMIQNGQAVMSGAESPEKAMSALSDAAKSNFETLQGLGQKLGTISQETMSSMVAVQEKTAKPAGKTKSAKA